MLERGFLSLPRELDQEAGAPLFIWSAEEDGSVEGDFWTFGRFRDEGGFPGVRPLIGRGGGVDAVGLIEKAIEIDGAGPGPAQDVDHSVFQFLRPNPPVAGREIHRSNLRLSILQNREGE